MSTRDYYRALGMDFNAYIEDEQISRLARHLKVNFMVFRIQADLLVVMEFDSGSDTTLPILNFHPYHFCPINKIQKVGGKIPLAVSELKDLLQRYDMTNGGNQAQLVMDDLSDHPPVRTATSRTTADQLYLPPIESRESEAMELLEEEADQVYTFSVPYDETNFAQLYAFLCDSGDMIFPTPEVLLESFRHVHNLFTRSLMTISEKNLIVHKSYIKMYHKYRHNVFATLCKYAMGFPPGKLDTDVPLTGYVDSKKTPDMIVETDTSITIFEFTVGNTYERVDYVKGGGNYDLKYTDECREIEIATGKRTTVKIVAAVLTAYNIEEIQNVLAIAPYPHFEVFFDVCNEDRDIISNSYVKSWESNIFKAPDFPNLTMYERPSETRVVLLPHDVISALSTDFGMMYSRLEGLPPHLKYKLTFDVETCRYKFERSAKRGEYVRELLNKLTPDISKLIPLISFKSGNSNIPLSKLRGTVPVTIHVSSDFRRHDVWIEATSFDSVYTKTVPERKPGYDDPAVFDDSMLISKEDLPKVAFPPDYFEKLCSLDVRPILECQSTKMLYNCKMGPSQPQQAIDLFNAKMSLVNRVNVTRAKPTFMLGVVTVPLQKAEISVPTDVCKMYLKFGNGEYTKAVLDKASKGIFCTTKKVEHDAAMREAYEAYHNANSEYHKKLISLHGSATPFKKLDKETQKTLEPLHKSLSKTHKEYLAVWGKGKSVVHDRLVKINCGGSMKNKFDSEMAHYSRSEGLTGLGLLADTTELGDYYKKFLRRLVDNNFLDTQIPEPFDPATTIGSKFLSQMKATYQKRWSILWSRLDKSMLMMNCLLHEHIANFLFNESLKTYNRNYVKVDNLGMSGVMIMLRGGNKIFRHQRSRLYRLFFPISPEDLKYSGYLQNDSYEIIRSDGKIYIVTPWSQVHQDILFDYMFAVPRVFNQLFSICSRVDSSLEKPIPLLSILPTLLFFHNRRKTEKLLHNSRYLIVNPLGLCANLAGIIEGFADINKTWLDLWFRSRISDSYPTFARKMMQLRDSNNRRIDLLLDTLQMRDLWLDEPLATPDLLTLFIYSTYMMTKAPVNSSLEQAGNLWEVLEDVSLFDIKHGDVRGLDDNSLRMDVLKFDPDVYDDDFKYDPVFCQYLGHYMANYLNNAITPSELSNKWDSICARDLDTIANSNGLRGWNKNNFFGKKGYEVVYEKVDELLQDVCIQDRIEAYMKLDLQTSAATIQADKTTLAQMDCDFESLVFHIVHKIQRGGSREIFCMDLNTKALQNPIESFFAHICKKVPNEFISIPSSKRHAKIHADFYEKNISKWVKKVVRWVLDCRRWAPHSVFQKYVHFINGMSHILPPQFLDHFYKFAQGMFTKKFVTREHVVSKMRNNKRFEPYLNSMASFDRVADAYSIGVQFSFVMGIFNYLSTLMHAANQLVASEVIRQQALNSGLGLVVLDPKCHSDDSVVSSYHEDPASIELSVKLYDWLLKGANHMLSIKKSQVNEDVYLEFLSTLYMFDRFLPVFPKFISTIPFKPTDEGLYSDITFAASQAIEMLTMGGTMEEAYLIMKTTDKAIRKIYRLTSVEGVPPQLFGPLDAHPIELLFCGAEADLMNHYMYNSEKFWAIYKTLAQRDIVKLDNAKFTLNWDMGAFLDNRIMRKLSVYKSTVETLKDAEWTMANCKLGNSTLNLMWYYLKMRDRKFRSSLIDEPVARRMSRIFGSARYRKIKAGNSLVDVENILAIVKSNLVDDKLTTMPKFADDYLAFMSKGLKDLHDSLADSELTGIEPSNIKEKPIVFIVSNTKLGSGTLSASEYVSYKKEPLGYKLLGKFKNPARETLKIDQELKILGVDPDEMPCDFLYQITRKLLGNDLHTYRMVSAVPSGHRVFSTHSSYLSYLESNSFAHQKLRIKNTSAAAIDWKRKLTAGKMPESAKQYITMWWTCSFLAEHGILDKDLYHEDLRHKERILADSLPDEWKLILLTSVEQRSSPLSDIGHWCYWEKEQLKLGNVWVGSGVCIVRLPEATFKLYMSGGFCNKIQVKSTHSGLFSQSSSWYLHNVLSNNAVSAQYFDPSLASPNSVYVGLTANSTIYGIGRANNFDLVFEVEWVENDPIPSDFYKTMPYTKERSHYIYHGTRKYYIDFFVPVDDPVKISLKGIFDLEKIRQHHNDPDVSNFVKKVAVDVGGLLEIDREFFVDNIGSSTLYNLLFESAHRQSLIANEPVTTVLPEAFESWRRTHDDFGYPTEEELKEHLADTDSPPFPRTIMNYLLKSGASNLSHNEFEAILLQLSKLSGEDRMVYLAGQLGYMDQEMRLNSLVLASRTKLVYKSTYLIGVDSLQLLIPLVRLIGGAIKQHNLNIPTLNSIRKALYYSKRIKIDVEDIFNEIGFKAILDCYIDRLDMSRHKSVHLLMKCIREGYQVGLGLHLNTTPTTDPLMRTIDFAVEFEVIEGFVDDLLNGVKSFGSKVKLASSLRMMLRNIPPAAARLNEISAAIMKYTCYNKQPSLEVHFKNSKMLLKSADPLWGDVLQEFLPRDEDNRDELRAAMEMGDYDEIEFFEFDDEAEIPEFAFVNLINATLLSIASGRGTAWGVFYKCCKISPDIKQIKDQTVKIFKKHGGYHNFHTYLESEDGYIIYVGTKNVHCQIPGYRLLSFEEEVKEFRPKYEYKRVYNIDGELISREKLTGDFSYHNKIYQLDSYFKSIKVKTLEEAEKEMKQAKKFEEAPNPLLNKLLDKIESLKLGKVEDDVVEIDFAQIFLEYQESLLESIGEQKGPLQEHLRVNYSNFNFSEPLRVLSDVVVRSEINVLFPGYVDKILDSQIRLSKETKKRIIKFAQLTIQTLPKMLRKKYTKLLYVVKCVLADIEECNFNENETHEFAAVIDMLFAEAGDTSSSEDEYLDLLPDSIEDKVQFDLTKLFG
jgi:hypothetical protein